MSALAHAVLLLKQLARWPRLTTLIGVALLGISVFQSVETDLPLELTILSSIGYLSAAFLFKGLLLFAPYRPLQSETFSGSYLLIAVMLTVLWLPFMAGGFQTLVYLSHAAVIPPGWFLALTSLSVVLFCWVVMRRTNLKRSPR